MKDTVTVLKALNTFFPAEKLISILETLLSPSTFEDLIMHAVVLINICLLWKIWFKAEKIFHLGLLQYFKFYFILKAQKSKKQISSYGSSGSILPVMACLWVPTNNFLPVNEILWAFFRSSTLSPFRKNLFSLWKLQKISKFLTVEQIPFSQSLS